jgi:hypothetical protein
LGGEFENRVANTDQDDDCASDVTQDRLIEDQASNEDVDWARLVKCEVLSQMPLTDTTAEERE